MGDRYAQIRELRLDYQVQNTNVKMCTHTYTHTEARKNKKYIRENLGAGNGS